MELTLNLPPFEMRLRSDSDGRSLIFDPLRAKWVVVTPEEWVRQHFVNYLTTRLGYPAGRMANEIQLSQNGRRRRCDTVVYDRYLQPLVIVEYKRPDVVITQAVFDQIARYNSVLTAPWLMVSNGLKHYCCRFDKETGRYTFVRGLPQYNCLV